MNELDDLLDASAPTVSVDSPGVERELYALSVAAEASTRRPPRNRGGRYGLLVAAILLLAGGATAAVAAPVLLRWTTTWTPDAMSVVHVTSGTSCEMRFKVGGLDREGTAAARAYIASLELGTISVDDAVEFAEAREIPLAGRTLAEKRAAAVSVFIASSTNAAIVRDGFPDSTLTIDEEMHCFKNDSQ